MREYKSEEQYRRMRRQQHLLRQKKMRRQKMIRTSIISALCIFSIILFAFKLTANAKTVEQEQPVYKYFTSYQIQYGDTLWEIAQAYHPDSTKSEIADVVKEIRSINHLSPYEGITAGEHVVVPYYSTEYK